MPDDLVRQIGIARGAIRAMGMPCLVIGDVEADDVIATLCRRQCPTRIISSDKDLMQLVSECVFVFDTMKNLEFRGPDVVQKYGVRPDQMIDYQALVGDTSDNVPGVHGIGPKKAAELLGEFGTLDGVYENLASVKNARVRELLAAGRDSALMSRKLVALKTDVEIPPFPPYRFDAGAAAAFFLNEVGSPTLAEKARRIGGSKPDAQSPAPAPGGIYIFNPDIDIFSSAAIDWDKMRDPSVRKIAYDWKTIFHRLDDAGFDVSEIAPIDDVMLMNYAVNRKDSGDAMADYDLFMKNPAKIYDMDLAILRPLFHMEKNGVLVDAVKLKEISGMLHRRANDLQMEIWALAGVEFNVASPKQLAEILFDKLKLPANKKRSTDADVLSDLAAEHEIARLVLDWRSLTKLSGTYADALPRAIGADGRIHTDRKSVV
jgi:DNA polymerase-1